MSLKTNCKNFKSRSCPNNSLTFIDKYKFEVFYDRKYFGDNTKIYHCDKCDICFIDPMPSNETLDNFYKKHCSMNKIDYIPISTDNSLDISIMQYLIKRNKLI